MKKNHSDQASNKPAHTGLMQNWSIKKLFVDGAAEWDVSQKVILFMCSVPFIVALIGLSTALISKDLYKWFTGEDRIAETLQVLFYAIAFVFCIMNTRHLLNSGQKRIALLYLFVAFGLFFMVGEELNWGQRIFGWSTPESFALIHKQKETNLHNIYGVGTTFKWIQMLAGAYGTILPLVVLRSTSLERYRQTISMLVPHYTLIPYFIIGIFSRLPRITILQYRNTMRSWS
ncbi:MAG: hypothetical protein ACE5NG_04735 [bacterium]